MEVDKDEDKDKDKGKKDENAMDVDSEEKDKKKDDDSKEDNHTTTAEDITTESAMMKYSYCSETEHEKRERVKLIKQMIDDTEIEDTYTEYTTQFSDDYED